MKTRCVLLGLMLFCMFGGMAWSQEATIGSDADTYLRDATVRGDENSMNILGGGDMFPGYFRFDLGAINVNTVLDAQLVLRNSGAGSRNDVINTGRFALHGLNNVAGNTPQDWDETVLAEDNVGAEFSNGVVLEQVTNLDADDGADITEDIVGEGTNYWDPGYYTITISGQDLIDFLQTRASDGGLATFILVQDDGNTRGYGICSKEFETAEWQPTLTLTYIAGGATDPVPADGSVVTDLNLSQLCWQNSNVELANIWFGAGAGADVNDLNYQSLLTQIETIESPGESSCVDIPAEELPLDVPETYFWVVETYGYPESDPNHTGEPNQLIGNSVWSFNTSAIPVAQTEPVDQFVFPTETASYAVQFLSLTEVTDAVWYKTGDPDTAMDPAAVEITPDGDDLYTVSLTIENTQLADEGTYYCIAENDGGLSDPSASADLVIKRRLAYWAFEDSLADAEGNYDGTAAVDPNYTEGFTGSASSLGQALLLDGSTDYVILPEGFANFKSGLTFMAWANPSSAAGWSRFIDLGNGPGVDNIFMTREGTTSNLIFNNGSGVVNAAGAIALNEWQFFVATMDEAGNVVLYDNGVPAQTGTVGIPDVISRTLNYIGESNYESDSLFAGMLDEISVYNYALTEDEVADMYAGVYGDYCRYPEIAGDMDFNDNCIVDLPDFAEFAGQWLNCGLYPNCP